MRRGAFRGHGFINSARKCIESFGLLFLREIEFIPSAMHVNDRINYTAGKGPAVGASGHRIECMPGLLGRQGMRMPTEHLARKLSYMRCHLIVFLARQGTRLFRTAPFRRGQQVPASVSLA